MAPYTVIATRLIIAKTTMIGIERFNHARYDTPARARPPINEAMVGAIIFNRPDAAANATTMISLLEPTRSATGAMTGIVAAARPDDDGMIK